MTFLNKLFNIFKKENINEIEAKENNEEENIAELETQLNNQQSEIDKLKKELKEKNKKIESSNKTITKLQKQIEKQNIPTPEIGGGQKQSVKTSKENPSEQTKTSQNKPKIYDPLPEQYMSNGFRNSIGIAWVNKHYNRYIYNKRDNGKHIYLSSNNINRLYEKVIENNLPWGIIDYNKASKIIVIPEEILLKYTNNSLKIVNEYWNNLIDIDARNIFQQIFVKNNKLYVYKSREAAFQLKTINYLKINLNKFEEDNYTLHEIYDELIKKELFSKPFNTFQLQRYLYSILLGVFDEFLKEYVDIINMESKDANEEYKNNHPFFKNFPTYQAGYYNDVLFAEDGESYAYFFTIWDIIYIKNKLDLYLKKGYGQINSSGYYEDTTDGIIYDTGIHVSNIRINRLLSAIGENNFEESINLFEVDSELRDIELEGIISPRYQKCFDEKFKPYKKDNMYHFTVKDYPVVLYMSIEDIIYLSETYSDDLLKNSDTLLLIDIFEDVYGEHDDFSKKNKLFGIFLFNILNGYFDKDIVEYKHSLNPEISEDIPKLINYAPHEQSLINKYIFKELTPSYRKSIENLKLVNGCITHNNNVFLFEELLYVRNNLLVFQKKNLHMDELFYRKYGKRHFKGEKGKRDGRRFRNIKEKVYQISQGYFDDVLNEYINYHYIENKGE